MFWDRFNGRYKPPRVYTANDFGGPLDKPSLEYRDSVSLISNLVHFEDNSYKDTQGLVFGCKENRYTSLAHVIWNSQGGVEEVKYIFNQSWFKENEDLGDIIKGHRQYQILIDSLENTVKSQKAKLVELYNDVQSLTTKLSTLAVKVNKKPNIKIKPIEGEHDN